MREVMLHQENLDEHSAHIPNNKIYLQFLKQGVLEGCVQFFLVKPELIFH
jgi:hypothetical protein